MRGYIIGVIIWCSVCTQGLFGQTFTITGKILNIKSKEGVGFAAVSFADTSGEVKEVMFALSTTMEGDTTNFFIYRKLSAYPVKVTVIARGISVGDEIEYADEVTLGRSILNRVDFNESIKL